MSEKIHRNSLQPGYKLHWYRIKKVLGQGGFGITYLAEDFNLDEDVAIKEYLPIELAVRENDFSVHPVSENQDKNFKWGLTRFIDEARTLAKFKHPNIVRVRNVFEENNTAYMVMEYEQGQSLQEILSVRKTLEEPELLKILLPILGGLQLVHEAGFIHRDIKPANIFIREDQSPVLLDFGSARAALGQETKTLTSLVSPGYAPFEQYYSKGDKQGPWTDIYGMAATMYRAISGRAPLDAVDRSEAILHNDEDLFVGAVDIGKGKYSERFLRAVDIGLSFKLNDRPKSIDEWKDKFQLASNLFTKSDEKKILQQENVKTELDINSNINNQKKQLLEKHIKNILFLGVVFSLIWIYFTLNEKSTLINSKTIEPNVVFELPIDNSEINGSSQAQYPTVKTKNDTVMDNDVVEEEDANKTIKQILPKSLNTISAGEGPDKIVMTVLDDSWIEIYDAFEKRIFMDLGKTGEKIELKGTAPFNVILGNATGVSIIYNGVPVDDMQFSENSGVARLTLDTKNTDVSSSNTGLNAWVVQIGEFSSRTNAENLNLRLSQSGFPSFVEPKSMGDKQIYRVRVGPELLRSDAEKMLKSIKSKLNWEGIVLSYP